MIFPLSLLGLFAVVTSVSLIWILRRHDHPVLAVWVGLGALLVFAGIFAFLTLWFFPQMEGL
jgi:hypothetical protein